MANSTNASIENSSVISFPSSLPAPEAERWWLEHKTQIFTSPLSAQEQRIALQAARWRAEIVFPNLKENEARALLVFVAQLQGAKGKFLYSPAHNRSARWSSSGEVPIVANPPTANPAAANPAAHESANQTAATKLYIDLATSSAEHRIKAGDYFTIRSELGETAMHIVTKSWQPIPQGEQFACIDISPPLRFQPIVDTEVELLKPKATMRLLNDTQARMLWRRGLIVDGLTLALSEVV